MAHSKAAKGTSKDTSTRQVRSSYVTFSGTGALVDLDSFFASQRGKAAIKRVAESSGLITPDKVKTYKR